MNGEKANSYWLQLQSLSITQVQLNGIFTSKGWAVDKGNANISVCFPICQKTTPFPDCGKKLLNKWLLVAEHLTWDCLGLELPLKRQKPEVSVRPIRSHIKATIHYFLAHSNLTAHGMGNTELVENTADVWKVNLVFPVQLNNLPHTFFTHLTITNVHNINKKALYFTSQ